MALGRKKLPHAGLEHPLTHGEWTNTFRVDTAIMDP